MTPFARLAQPELEKVALAKGVGRGLGLVGQLLRRSGGAAKATAGRNVFSELGGRAATAGAGNRAAMKSLTAGAANAAGNGRLALAGKFNNASKAVATSPGIQKAINYGGGAALAGAGLYGSNRAGYASGHQAGIGEGLDTGMQAGVQAAMQDQAQSQSQTGYLGSLWDAIRGEPIGGMNVGNVFNNLGAQRQQLVNRLMGASL